MLIPDLTPLRGQALQLCWLRRDLRLEDHHALYRSLQNPQKKTLLLFIFDKAILDKLDDPQDRRVAFIHDQLTRLQKRLTALGSTLLVTYGHPLAVLTHLFNTLQVEGLYFNEDYEPYAIERDLAVRQYCAEQGVGGQVYKDHVIFDPLEVTKAEGGAYTVYTPYMKKWKACLEPGHLQTFPAEKRLTNLVATAPLALLSLEEIGFTPIKTVDKNFPPLTLSPALLTAYASQRDRLPGKPTTGLGVHLRFGTLSIRKATQAALLHSEGWLNQLIWRNFYIMILYRFPHVVNRPFRKKYENIAWSNDQAQFATWCAGRTGFPVVDAGMRQLNRTGKMHNRSRMVAANFLTKCLLIDWRWGEAYFAKKLLDYDLALNNGNWQWSAGCGCDAAPYFRIFNPILQAKKFDPEEQYIRKWLPEYGTPAYPAPMVDYAQSRREALAFFKAALA